MIPILPFFFLFGSTSRHVTGRKCRLKLTVQDAKKKKGERVSVTAQSTFIPWRILAGPQIGPSDSTNDGNRPNEKANSSSSSTVRKPGQSASVKTTAPLNVKHKWKLPEEDGSWSIEEKQTTTFS